MPLYQPSNITPSSFAGMGAGVIDANDQVSISWQVNGTAALTGFSIAIYQNTASSTPVATLISGPNFQPFYGTDEKGNPVFFVYEPGVTWASQGLSNGNSYKLKITQKWLDGSTTKSVTQNSETIFITRAAPLLSVSPASGTLSSVSQTFTASYSQAQGDGISSVRWVLSDAEGTVLDDTGTIYTGLLSYTYDGFFNGQTYSLKCTVQSSSGAEVSVTNSYAVSYEAAEQAGGISLSCNPDDSVTLSWAAGADIPGNPSASDYGTLAGGVLHLAAERSITWNTVNGQPMAFSSPYCFAWRGRIGENVTETETVNSGTWELWKTYPETRNMTESHTTSAGAWSVNPSASTTGTRDVNASVSVSPHISRDYTFASSKSSMNTVVAGAYTYKTGSPCVIETYYDILEWDTDKITAYYYADNGQWTNITDALLTVARRGDRTLDVDIYTNLTEVYGKQVLVAGEITCVVQYVGSATAAPAAGDTGISGPVVVYKDPALTSVSVSYSASSNRFSITATASSAGTHRITIRYTYTLTPDNAYMARWGGTLAVSGAVLTSASVASTTATGGAVVSVNRNISGQSVQNAFAVTEYNADNTAATQTVVRLNYTVQVAGSDSYRSIVTVAHPGAQSASIRSTTAQRATIDGGVNGVYTVTMYASSDGAKTAVVAFNSSRPMEMEDILVLSNGTVSASLGVQSGAAVFTVHGEEAASVPVPEGTWNMMARVAPGIFDVFFLNAGNTAVLGEANVSFAPVLPAPVSSVVLNGEQWCDYTVITQTSAMALSPLEEPGWSGDTLFYAAFARDLQAGTVGSGESLSVAVYRQEGTVLSPVGVFESGVKTIRDYAIRSGVEYRYAMFYISNGTYSAGAGSSALCRQFRQHTLIEAEKDAELVNVYHPVNVWRFRDNVDAGGYTNQNQPVLLENFTKYPLWQPSCPAAKTGTLTALLGWFENGTYSGDNAAAMEALFALSESMKPLFYRDMKGNLYMVRLSGPITQTIDNSSASLPVSVSVPWVEVGDVDGVRIYTEG